MELATNDVFGVEYQGNEVDVYAQGDRIGEYKYTVQKLAEKLPRRA